MTMILMKTWSCRVSKNQILKKNSDCSFFYTLQNLTHDQKWKKMSRIGKHQIPNCHPSIFLHSAHPSESDFCIVIVENLHHFLKTFFSKSRSFNWMQTKRVLSPISCILTQADTKIFSVHFFMLCKAIIDFGEVWNHFCKAIFTLKSDT